MVYYNMYSFTSITVKSWTLSSCCFVQPLMVPWTVLAFLYGTMDQNNAGEFEHQRIEQNCGIRLLRLYCQPLFPGAPIKCDMIHATLTPAPQHIAVLHAWGKQVTINRFLLMVYRIVCHPTYILFFKQRDLDSTVASHGLIRYVSTKGTTSRRAARLLSWGAFSKKPSSL